MGLMEDAASGVSVIHYGGSQAGFKSDIVIVPEAGVGAVILTNSDTGRLLLRPFRRRLLELQRRVVHTSPSLLGTQTAVRAGLGIGVLPQSLLQAGLTAAGREHDLPSLGAIEILLQRLPSACEAASCFADYVPLALARR
jgi:hypothetical protein